MEDEAKEMEPRRKRASRGTEEKNYAEAQSEGGPAFKSALMDLEKLSLANAQGQRALASTVWAFAIFPISSGVVKKGLEAGQQYAEGVRKQGRGHNLGVPHPHVVMAMCEALKAAEKTAAEHAAVLGKLLNHTEASPQAVICDIFP